MSKVYVVQESHRINDLTGELESKHDLSSASKYGELIYLLSPSARPFMTTHVIAQLREKLLSYGDDDYLLLVGNPCLIGFATAIASDLNDGRVRVLQWDARRREYVEIRADLDPEQELGRPRKIPR